MNEFFDYFERFAPSAWLNRGGIVARDATIDAATRARGAASKVRVGCASMLISASVFAGSVMAAPAENASVNTVTVKRQVNSEVFAEDVVPPGHWAGMIVRLNAAPVVRESDYQDFESLY